jgi:hypothetical protein
MGPITGREREAKGIFTHNGRGKCSAKLRQKQIIIVFIIIILSKITKIR